MAIDINITQVERINVKHEAKVKDFTSVDPFLTKFFGEYDFNRYGIIGALIVIVVCMAGIAVAFGAMASTFQVMILVIPTMLCLTFVLAVSPMKLILYTGLTSIIISMSVIALNILA